eukprot:TRINITY_DN2427_c0_g6_i1.p1 TRINITY_DN2427_c0_g6~~TRINITY_DN2427_c0_g6_i1.p1  ORF type:complete len:402 (+),score=54.74 TRINITY_DN2427_c0_g6_i1:152-1357(+)
MISQCNGALQEKHRGTASAACIKAPLLPPQPPHSERKTLVLDLDETLVHSALQRNENAHIVLPVRAENESYCVYVSKRPGLDYFLKRMSQLYEIVIFTASLPKYADRLITTLDPCNYVSHRLFREHCRVHNNAFVKDLEALGRKLPNTIIVDNSPTAYLLQPENALPISTWVDDRNDKSLYELASVLEILAGMQDVRKGLKSVVKGGSVDCTKAVKELKEIANMEANGNVINANGGAKQRRIKSALLKSHGTLRQKSQSLMKKISKSKKNKIVTRRSASSTSKTANKLCLDFNKESINKRKYQVRIDSKYKTIHHIKSPCFPSSTNGNVKGGNFIENSHFIDMKSKESVSSSILNLKNLIDKNSFGLGQSKGKWKKINKDSTNLCDKRKLFKCLGGIRRYI